MPSLALIPYLEKKFDNIVYIGSEGGMEESLAERAHLRYYPVKTAKLQRKFTFQNLKIPVDVLKGYRQAKKVLSEVKPDVVFSKGGYVAVPVAFAAKSLKIPVVTHESDLTAGLANKLIAPRAKKVLTAFPETAKEFPNGEYAGLPLNDELFSTDKKTALARYGFKGQKPVLLVLGGSQGSKTINACLAEALNELLPKFDILHLYGRKNTAAANREGYVGLEFESEMRYAYAAADVAVSRAGAGTLFELLSLKIPSVVIPLSKNASRGDQILNAEYFFARGALSLIYEHNLTPRSLETAVSAAYADRFNFKRRLNKLGFENANARVANVLLSYRKSPQA